MLPPPDRRDQPKGQLHCGHRHGLRLSCWGSGPAQEHSHARQVSACSHLLCCSPPWSLTQSFSPPQLTGAAALRRFLKAQFRTESYSNHVLWHLKQFLQEALQLLSKGGSLSGVSSGCFLRMQKAWSGLSGSFPFFFPLPLHNLSSGS